MAFTETGALAGIETVEGGVRYGNAPYIQTDYEAGKFVDGIKVGRVAQFKSDKVQNFDDTSTPTIAGVVLYNPAGPIDGNATFHNADNLDITAEVIEFGLVTVQVKANETPAKFGQVHVEDTTSDDYGKVKTSGGVTYTGATFYQKISDTVWAIKIK